MKHLYLVAALLLPLSSPAMAQSTEALAKQYAELPDVVQMMDEMFSPETQISTIEANFPPTITLSEDQRQRIGALISDGLSELRPRLEKAMIEGIATNFSAPEIQALIDFYSSEHGAAVMRKMPLYMEEVMREIGPDQNAILNKMLPQVIQIIREKD
jgi:hypothetical protein